MRDRRRLAAIVAADVAGYSKLMRRDDSGTLSALKAHRRDVIDPKVAEYGGRVVKSIGDGLLMEFPSVVDATRCAVDVQRALAARNADVHADRRIAFRMGVNVGDVIIDGDDIFGDGVNVAARLEALAEPGGICVSRRVYEEVSGKVEAAFADRGLQRVKNIEPGVHVYALQLDGTTAASAGVATPAAEVSSLYGRADDVSALCALVAQKALVTVVGPAGVGKTRLAEAVAHASRNAFGDAVRVVELASLADPGLVPLTIARALDLVVGEPDAALDVLVQSLAGQRLLLVLDNCEHVLDEAGRIVDALRRGASGVHILITSQEVLRHVDEQVYRLSTLGLPAEATVASARAAGAVQLFTARANAADPAFELTDGNVRAVIDICRRLDGMPLAIELAAARVPLLGVEGVRQRLDERFRLLTAGSRLALRKHQTLHAALEWSYSLLSQAEQIVFDRLGVFAGGFSMEAAQGLAADEAIDAWAVLDHVGALVNKSLVIVDKAQAARYRLLETTRAFALERLAARGETARIMRAHAEVMERTFEQFYADLMLGTPLEALAPSLAHDLDNLRGALRWALSEDGDRRIAAALIGAAGAGQGYFRRLQIMAEGWEWCKALKPLMDDSVPPANAARFWLACAELGTTASIDAAAEDARRALALFEAVGDRVGMFLALCWLMYCLTRAGRMEQAFPVCEQAQHLYDHAWPSMVRAIFHNIAGILFAEADRAEDARRELLEHLALSRESGAATAELSALVLLLDTDLRFGDVERAADSARELLARYRSDPERYMGLDIGLQLRNVATALMSANALEEAEAVYREAVVASRRNYGSGAFVLDDMATLLARRGRLDDAARVSAYAAHVYARMGRRPRLVARRMREQLHELLASRRSCCALERLYEDGRSLGEDQACALALKALDGASAGS